MPKHLRAKTLSLLLSVLAMTASGAGAACLEGPFKVNFPPQRLDERLQAVYMKTGCFIEVDTTLLKGRKSPRVRGTYSNGQILLYSLENTGLASKWVGDHWVVDADEEGFYSDPQ